MPRLDCMSILEAGSFGSDSGTIVVPTGSAPFSITAFAAFASAGDSAVAFVGVAQLGALFTAAGSSTVSWVGSSAVTGRDAITPDLFVNLSGNARQAMTPGGMLDGA